MDSPAPANDVEGRDLDHLAVSFADTVNTTLANGLDATGQPPTQPLFTYSVATGAAATLAANPLVPNQLAAAAVGAPSGNGNALALAAILSASNIDDLSFTQFYGDIAGRVGRALSIAQEDQQTHRQLLAQAKSVREEKTAISLDEEAANLIQFQRAYQATATLFRTLDEMTQDLINIKR